MVDGLVFHSTTRTAFVALSLKCAVGCFYEEELDLFCCPMPSTFITEVSTPFR